MKSKWKDPYSRLRIQVVGARQRGVWRCTICEMWQQGRGRGGICTNCGGKLKFEPVNKDGGDE